MNDPVTRNLPELESVIERGLATFVDVGTALAEIRDRGLYRERHNDFDSYCRERWHFSRQRAYQMIEAATITAELSTIVDTPPARESQVRELSRVPSEQRAEVWQAAVDEHGPEPTAKEVGALARRVTAQRISSWQPPTPISTPMTQILESMPEEQVEAIATDMYLVQLPALVSQVVSTAAGQIRHAAQDARKQIELVSWDLVTEDMKRDPAITDALRFMDAQISQCLDVIRVARPVGEQLRRVK